MNKGSSEKVSGRSLTAKAEGTAKRARAPSKKAASEKKGTRKAKAPDKGNVSTVRKASAKAGLKKEQKSAKAAVRDKKPERKSAVRTKGKAGEARARKNAPKKTTAGKAAASTKRSLAGKRKMPDIGPPAKGKKAARVGKEQKTAVIVEGPAKRSPVKTRRGTATARIVRTAGDKLEAGMKRRKTRGSSTAKKSLRVSREKLPAEYGENAVTLLPVDPHKLFVFWEVRRDSAETYEGDLTIRVYDVVGDGFNPAGIHSYFDVPAGGRIGRKYIDARPGNGFIAEIGISQGDIFITLARSRSVSTPPAGVSPPVDSSPEPSECEIRVGY